MLSFEIEAHKMINFKIVTFSSNMLSEKVLKTHVHSTISVQLLITGKPPLDAIMMLHREYVIT